VALLQTLAGGKRIVVGLQRRCHRVG
jgi:hypothetical protein